MISSPSRSTPWTLQLWPTLSKRQLRLVKLWSRQSQGIALLVLTKGLQEVTCHAARLCAIVVRCRSRRGGHRFRCRSAIAPSAVSSQARPSWRVPCSPPPASSCAAAEAAGRPPRLWRRRPRRRSCAGAARRATRPSAPRWAPGTSQCLCRCLAALGIRSPCLRSGGHSTTCTMECACWTSRTAFRSTRAEYEARWLTEASAAPRARERNAEPADERTVCPEHGH
mmetsp:Transcript_110107/g.350792  ORF Transcript_110107/g.350792 Transcript_110107/m.350792 type:complete len:225 (-) Transcript_110107:84-758(-)